MKENAVNRIKSFAEDLISDRRRLIRILLIILILLMALVLRLHENSKSDITIEDNTSASSSDEICVDIGGAVVKPGVYTVGPETRLYEVIELAGGLLSNADTDSINRAEYVEDGEKIIIPSRYIPPESTGEDAADGDMPSTEGPDEATTPSSSAGPSAGGLININSASKDELKTLSGIGDVKAEKIIEYRKSSRFRKKEDIKKVEGIGDAIYNNIKDMITV